MNRYWLSIQKASAKNLPGDELGPGSWGQRDFEDGAQAPWTFLRLQRQSVRRASQDAGVVGG